MSKRLPFEVCVTDIPSVAVGEGASRPPPPAPHPETGGQPLGARFHPLVLTEPLPVSWAPAAPTFSIVCFFCLPFSWAVCCFVRDPHALLLH